MAVAKGGTGGSSDAGGGEVGADGGGGESGAIGGHGEISIAAAALRPGPAALHQLPSDFCGE